MNHARLVSRGPGQALLRALLLGGAAFALMAVNDDNGCGGSAEPPEEGRRAACRAASDCGGDPGVDCAGEWQCRTGECAFECRSQPIEDTSGDTRDADVRPEPVCYSDADCKSGQLCALADNCACPSGANCLIACSGVCVDAPSPKACTSSESCGAGEYCTVEDGVCDSNCPPGMACPAVCWGTCEPIPTTRICYGDAECGFGEFCDMDPCVFPGDRDFGQADRLACGGVCAPIQSCQSDRDCGAGEFCGCGGMPNALMPCLMQCLPRHDACNAQNDCPAGQVCESGVCTPSRECGADGECPRGWTCESVCGFDDPAFAPGGPGDEANRPAPCPNVCVPPAGPTCEDGLTTCGPGERCEQVCWADCPACDCAPGMDCICPPCMPSCFTTCVPAIDPVTCSSDHECARGEVCDFSGCNFADPDPSGAAGRPVACLGECRPAGPPTYDCSQDSDCVSPTGQAGVCELEFCEYANFPLPCDAEHQSCDPRPPHPSCYGYCNFEQPAWCNPWDTQSCPDGFTCESECETGASNALIYCPSRCVPKAEPTACVVTGCSGQVCAPDHVATTCEWRPWYVCYRDARCGTQADGSCGWHETDAFEQCMREHGAYRR